MSEPTKIVFGILSTYERHGWHHPSLTQFFADLPFTTGTSYRMIPINNFIPAAAGRNVFCKQLKDCDADWLCMIDNDMVIPDNFLDTLKDVPADADIVVPAFYIWDQTSLNLTLCWGWDGAAADGRTKQLPPGFHELTKAGTGAIFLRPSVFNKLPYPYFQYEWNEDAGLKATEDIPFCIRAREAGIKIYGNPSVIVGHYHSVELSTLWKWGDKMYIKDTVLANGNSSVAQSAHQDAGSPPVELAAVSKPQQTAPQ
jgi:hypothetical protein